MKILKSIFSQIIDIRFYFIFFLFTFSHNILANENNFEFNIVGNENTDKEVILTIIDEIPDDLSEEFSNYLLKELNKTGLFKDINISLSDNKYNINVIEYPVIQKIYFEGNERIKDEDLNQLVDELDLNVYNKDNIKNFTSELKLIYSSFGYNDINIEYSSDINKQNLATLYVEITENRITKIKEIKFIGNKNINSFDLSSIIKSKIKKLTNIFANNNFKPTQIDTDRQRLLNYYKERGYANIKINYDIEFFKDNSVNIYFNINEGVAYELGEIIISNNLEEESINDILNDYLKSNNYENVVYNTLLLIV